MSSLAPASILNYFRDLPDPRRETRNKKHRLIDILVIALCGTIAGCHSAVEIAAYGRAKREWLKTFLALPNGIPSHDTFSRALQLLDARKFHDCFVAWVRALHEITRGQIVPIDGKTLRRSFDSAHDLPALHLVSAWAAENRLVLGEIPVDDKSNEITAIPKLLEILELTGAIVTIDAMGCQKEIAAKVREKEADYLLAVKENQPHLYQAALRPLRPGARGRGAPAPRAAPHHRGDESRPEGAPDLHLDTGPRGPAESRGLARPQQCRLRRLGGAARGQGDGGGAVLHQ